MLCIAPGDFKLVIWISLCKIGLENNEERMLASSCSGLMSFIDGSMFFVLVKWLFSLHRCIKVIYLVDWRVRLH